jgi:hypothetical protein
MYASFQPRLGILHFTLAIVFFPFGAPQAQTVATPVRTARSLSVPVNPQPLATRASRDIGVCIAHAR